jgi:hypothetical protein
MQKRERASFTRKWISFDAFIAGDCVCRHGGTCCAIQTAQILGQIHVNERGEKFIDRGE